MVQVPLWAALAVLAELVAVFAVATVIAAPGGDPREVHVVMTGPDFRSWAWCGHSHRTDGAAEDCGWRWARREDLPEWRFRIVSQLVSTEGSLGDDRGLVAVG